MGKMYYLGLDIGTNSVGYAVTDPSYHLLKFKGEPMWGAHVFAAGNQSAERRSFRTSRRRLDRRQQRVKLVQEIFAPVISPIDPRFFIRLHESALWRDDVAETDKHIFFNDPTYTDKEYYSDYPTIHHLIVDLMESSEKHDPRLVYLAVAWLVAHRGHFLNEVDKDNIGDVLSFDAFYPEFLAFLSDNGVSPWVCESKALQATLLSRNSVNDKYKALKSLIFGSQKPEDNFDANISEDGLIQLLAGKKVKVNKLFPQESNDASFTLNDKEDAIEEILGTLTPDECEWIAHIRRLFDWAIMKHALKDGRTISESKVKLYEQHHHDLTQLKYFVKTYLAKEYDDIFRNVDSETTKNYVAYSYHVKEVKGTLPKNKATQEEFCKYVLGKVKNIECSEADKVDFDEMIQRLTDNSFMPKQVSGENRVIPYQLYYYELKTILNKAASYLPFLTQCGKDAISNQDKLLSIMTFRIPYFVGPLRKDNSEHAWLERKAGKIYPWNFNDKVDLDKSEEAFIRRMTNTCTYYPGEDVLPLDSLIYEKFMILNEINNIRIDGYPISVDVKQQVFGLFEKKRRVTVKDIQNLLLSLGALDKHGKLTGIDTTIHSNYNTYHHFKSLMERGVLTRDDVERIVERMTYSDDTKRVRLWLNNNYGTLTADDVKHISRLRKHDFGRLSKMFLTGLKGVHKETGERASILDFMWNTNDNLMQLLSECYTFSDEITKLQEAYYAKAQLSLNDFLDSMYISNAVKRPIYRTLAVVNDIRKACGTAPKRIFIEMARDGESKKKRSVTRREQIKNLYRSIRKDFQQEVDFLEKILENKSDGQLQSDALYLYFAQLGRDMYTGDPIKLEHIKDQSFYNIDHIYPQSMVKDDSLDNKVLVQSEINGEKSSRYPLDAAIRNKMKPLWDAYYNHGLISLKKYQRLTRSTPFTDDEKWDFINRQLVETRQSTKALAILLKRKFPDTEIVYSKAGLSSDFRHEFGLVKSRNINDLHHAKDAFLAIVTGNVYHERFNRRWFMVNQPYSVKTKTLFTHSIKNGNFVAWNGEEDLGRIVKMLKQNKNNIHFTRFSFDRKEGLFDIQPLKASTGLVPRKAGLDVVKYGGYDKSTAAYYLLVRFTLEDKKTQHKLMMIPVEGLYKARIDHDKEFLTDYAQTTISEILQKDKQKVINIMFPMGTRHIKLNSMISIDDFYLSIGGKSSKGKSVLCHAMVPLIVPHKIECYIKAMESFARKFKENNKLRIVEKFDKITVEDNLNLYELFLQKLQHNPYNKFFSTQFDVLTNGRSTFTKLSPEEQVQTLLNILSIFKTCRSSGCDLKSINGSAQAARIMISADLTGLSKKYSDIRLVEQSASGLFVSKSQNLLEYL